MGGWVGEWLGRWMGGWVDGWVDECRPALGRQLPQRSAPHQEASLSEVEAWHNSRLLPQVLSASPRWHRVSMPRPPALSELPGLHFCKRSPPPFTSPSWKREGAQLTAVHARRQWPSQGVPTTGHRQGCCHTQDKVLTEKALNRKIQGGIHKAGAGG